MRFLTGVVAMCLVAAIGCNGCTAPTDAGPGDDACRISFRADATLSADQKDSVAAAFAMWNGVSTTRLCVSDDGPRTVRVIPDRGPEWAALRAQSDGGVAFIGLTLPTEIVIVDSLTPDEFRRTVQHEAGHVLGLGHVVGPPAVMSPAELYGSATLTAADLAECRRVGACE